MKILTVLSHARRAFRSFVGAAGPVLPRRSGGFLLAASLLWAGTVQAQVVATEVRSATDLGRDQIVNVEIDWSRVATGAGDKITLPIPPQLTAAPPAPPAGCVYTAPNPPITPLGMMVCDVPDGNTGAKGTITFQVRGLAIGGFNLTATGTSPPPASFSGTVHSTGDIVIGKAKTAPAGNPVAGGTVSFALSPQIASGDDVPLNASIVVTDNLPGTLTDFSLTNVAFAGLTPSCNTVANANSSRKLVCTYDGDFTRAQLNASTITLTGIPGNNGSFLNAASIASGNVNYFDADPGNNTANVNYVVDPGTDIQALGSFPAAAQTVGSAQSLVITYKNNGPQTSVAGGIVETIVPATFTLGALPAGCTQTPGQALTVAPTTYNGTLVRCTAGAVAVGTQQSFSIPLTAPAAPEASSFPVVVTPPPGMGDGNPGNNSLLLPYQIVNPYADLKAEKGKSPTGPQPPGTVVTTTLTIRNESTSPSAAAYDASQPLRIVDYARPEEVDGGTITNVSAGWTCSVTAGVVPPAFVGDSNKTTRIACQTTGTGTLAPNATAAVSFRSTIANVATPITLTDRACTGSRALEALGLIDADGPQPPDGGRTGNDCADAGSGLVATPVVAGKAQVSITKESSVDNVTYFDPVGSAPTLSGDANTLYWRMTITTPTTVQNAGQETIPTLRLTDTLPGILNVTSTGAPAPNFQTPAITVTTTPNTWGSCPNIGAGNNALTCVFNNVPAGTTIVVTVPVSRALDGGLLTNTATLTSPDAILSASAGGQLSDAAAVNVTPRVDVALTTKTVTPGTPSVGEPTQFTITAQNLGAAHITAPGQFTITDTLFTGAATLVTPAYEVLSVTPSNPAKISCAASNLAAGTISCTNLAQINRYETQTINIRVRIKKPAGLAAAANSVLYSGVQNTATVTLDPAYCEFKTETVTNGSVSAGCNDAAAKSNNSKTLTFDVKVPAIDLQQGKVAVFPAGQSGFLIGDQLRYRFSLRNAGPSRAEDVVMTDVLTVPPGFHISMAAGMPDRINAAAASTGYTLTPKAVTCTQAGQDANLVCKLNADPALNYLDAGQEVNFEIAMDMSGTAGGPVVFGNKAYVCADETNTYESSGKCSPDPALAGNNLAAVNNVVFPKTDLEVVSKTAVTPSPADIAQPIEYDIVLRNNGSSGTAKMRLRDTLPTGFEWLNSGAYKPVASVNAGSAATLSGALTVAAAVPPNGTENVCFISNGVSNLTTLTQQQEITCDISGNFPAGAANTITLKLYARAKPDLYDGSANAPYLANRTNTATVFPGKDAAGDDISIDDKPANDSKTTTVQVQKAQIGGRVFLDLNNNGDQDGTTLATDQGIGGVTITLSGKDKYGNDVLRSVTTSSVAAGPGSLRGDYLFDNLPPSDAAGYTITQTQPAAYGNGTPQPNTARPIRNGASTGASPAGGSYSISNTAATSVIGGIVLASGANGVQFDFPETQKPHLSGFVYVDANNDGFKDLAEAGINGVTMTLIGCGAGPNGILDTPGPIGAGPVACSGDDIPVQKTAVTSTDATFGAGFYQFPLDQAGRYTVLQQAAQPAVAGVTTLRGKTTAGSVDLVTSAAGANDGGTRGTVNATGLNAGGNAGVLEEINAAVGASQIRDIVISNSAAISVNNNFGEILPASIAGVVYTERGAANSNYAEGLDWPLPGAKLVLTGTDDLGQPVNLTLTTAADGSYRFDNLRPGTVYQVVKSNPSPAIVNETGGAYPGKDQGDVVRGARVDDNTINTVALASGTRVVRTNFAVTNGPAPVPPVEPPYFKLVKSHKGALAVGQPGSYLLTVTNIGGMPSTGAFYLADLLPAGLSLAATDPVTTAAGTVANLSVAGQLVKFDFLPAAPIAPGQSVLLTVNVEVGAAAVGNVVNYAVVSGGGDPFPVLPPGPGCADGNHCSSDPTVVHPAGPKFKLVKSHAGSFVAGKQGRYTLTVTNTGSAPSAGALRLNDLLPAGMRLAASDPVTSAAGTVGNLTVTGQMVKFDFTPAAPLAVGQSATLTLTVDVAAGASGTLINHASVSGGGDPFPETPPGLGCTDADHCSSDPTEIGSPKVSLKLVKSHSGAFAVGKQGTYTLTVSNVGGVASSGALRLSDLLPAGMRLAASDPVTSAAGAVSNLTVAGQLVKFDFTPTAPIAPGQSASLTVNVEVDAAAVGNVVNHASVSGGGDPFPETPAGPGCADAEHCSSDPTVVEAAKPSFKLVKSHSGAFVVGQQGTYTLTVSNVGGVASSGALRLSDLLPAGMRLAAVDPVTSAAGAVGNLTVAGQMVKFDFTPAAPIAPGQSVSLTVNVEVDVAAVGNVVNHASVSGGGDPFPETPAGPGCADAEHCSSDPTVVKGPPLLSLSKSGPATLVPGAQEEYLLSIRNSGESSTAGSLRLVEKLPPGLGLNGNPRSTDGAVANVVVSGTVGEGLTVTFDLVPHGPLAAAGGTATVVVPVTVGVDLAAGVLTNHAAVGGGGDLRDSGNPPAPGGECFDPRCANAPATVVGSALLSLTKSVSRSEAELGDVISYTVTVANIGNSPVPRPNIIDRLPAGFRLIENSSRVTGARLLRLEGAPGPVLTYALDIVNPGQTVTISYRVRLGVGAMQGDGVNRVRAECPDNGNRNCSNEARAQVRVSGGVFSDAACVVGMIYVDCNGNQIKDREEIGIPGVRLYFENGTFLISDSEGKYSFCGLSPKTHVLKVDQTTLPRGSRLVGSSNRNVGDANSLFVDVRKGELQRADFIEGSCSNAVLEQVKARRTQGEVTAPQAEKKGGPPLSFEGKAPNYPQQGTESANQLIVRPRVGGPAPAPERLENNQGGRRAN